eukprot:TRINITY_DN9597_c0_g2_i1.p1 TRINITY_DN9597_c0_g2~~TRINITY_DN9597_c0_g2_i1.p1  ORF type:complete len:331 (+),score=109.03 TRINITY_DN9597_c0_g2_i1:38-1030(+)
MHCPAPHMAEDWRRQTLRRLAGSRGKGRASQWILAELSGGLPAITASCGACPQCRGCLDAAVAEPAKCSQYCSSMRSSVAADCADVARVIDSDLLPHASSAQARVFFLTVKGDSLRRVSQLRRGCGEEAEAAATASYRSALRLADDHLSPLDTARLTAALRSAEHLRATHRDDESDVAVVRCESEGIAVEHAFEASPGGQLLLRAVEGSAAALPGGCARRVTRLIWNGELQTLVARVPSRPAGLVENDFDIPMPADAAERDAALSALAGVATSVSVPHNLFEHRRARRVVRDALAAADACSDAATPEAEALLSQLRDRLEEWRQADGVTV